MRLLVYGDSNSWGYGADGAGLRIAERWPVVMAREAGVDLIEDCLPGRTTVHDDPEMGGAAFNGLAHFQAVLLAHAPLVAVVIMLGTNDYKTRFAPDADKVAQNIRKLVDCARASAAGPGPWAEGATPWVGVVLPPPLPEMVNDPAWDRCGEWRGGRATSLALSEAARRHLGDVPVFDAGTVVSGSLRDPIHFEPDVHRPLGVAISDWIAPQLAEPGK